MIDSLTVDEPRTTRIRFYFGIAILYCGYATALVGCMATLRLSLVVSFGMMLGGFFIVHALPKLLDKRLALADFGSHYRVALFVGMIVIAVVVWILGGYVNVATWYLHPSGFQTTWIVLLTAIFHGRHIAGQSPRNKVETVVPPNDGHSIDETNPYAPPRS